MCGLDPAKLLVILVLALVVLGPERLPKAARQIGAFWRDFNLFRERLEQEVRSAIPDVDLPPIPRMPARGLTGYLTGMMQDSGRARPPAGEAAGGQDGSVDGEADDFDGAGAAEGTERAEVPTGAGVVRTPWRPSPSMIGPIGNPSPVVAPSGVPASWGSTAADAPGYASGSFLSSVPAAAPEGLLGAEARLDLDDPSWN